MKDATCGKRRRSVFPVIVPLLLFSQTALAGGLYVREFGQPSEGTSSAGGGVLAEDASTAFQNPSGLFLLDDDTHSMITGVVVSSKVEFEQEAGTTIPGNDGGDAGDTLYGAAVFHTRRLSEDWGLAFSLNSIAGSALHYDDGFVGRYTGDDVDLLTVLFTPNLAYRVNDKLSFSIGIPMLYGQLDLEAAVPPLIGQPTPDRDGRAVIEDGDDFSATLAASLLWQITDRFRLGLGYIGENELEFDGDLSVTLPGAGGGVTLDNLGADIEITFPQVLTLSAASEIGDRLTVTARIGWEDWSTLDSVPISTNSAGAAIPLNWDDVWSFALGMRWRGSGRWTYYSGISYDTDPTEPTDRISILPADEQWRFSAGLTYTMSGTKKIGVVVTYVDLGKAAIESSREIGTVVGEFDTNRAVFLGVNYAWN